MYTEVSLIDPLVGILPDSTDVFVRCDAWSGRWHEPALLPVTALRLLSLPTFCQDALPMAALSPFHLAFPVTSLSQARRFYGELLGCPEGRSSEDWVDFDFFGHQIVAHLSPQEAGQNATSAVDGHNVPVRHFGMVLDMPQWDALADKLRAANTKFVIEPYVRFKGEVGEQATMFLHDPCGNALEFKAFADRSQLFAK
jgi:uncharacterized protein